VVRLLCLCLIPRALALPTQPRSGRKLPLEREIRGTELARESYSGRRPARDPVQQRTAEIARATSNCGPKSRTNARRRVLRKQAACWTWLTTPLLCAIWMTITYWNSGAEETYGGAGRKR